MTGFDFHFMNDFFHERANHVGFSRFVYDADKIGAARTIIEELRKTKLKDNINELELLIEAYIELAFFDATPYKKETKPIRFPTKLKLKAIANLNNVHVPTAPWVRRPADFFFH